MTVEYRGKVRDRDPEASWEAAGHQDEAKLTEVKRTILSLLDAEPATDERLIERYNNIPSARRASPQSIRSRRNELALAGLVRETGETRPTQYGHPARVWEAA